MRAEEIYNFFQRFHDSIVEQTAERTVEMMLTAYDDKAPLSTDPEAEEMELMTLREAAKFLKVSMTTLGIMRKEGIIPTIMLGTTPRIDKADLIEHINAAKDYKQ